MKEQHAKSAWAAGRTPAETGHDVAGLIAKNNELLAQAVAELKKMNSRLSGGF